MRIRVERAIGHTTTQQDHYMLNGSPAHPLIIPKAIVHERAERYQRSALHPPATCLPTQSPRSRLAAWSTSRAKRCEHVKRAACNGLPSMGRTQRWTKHCDANAKGYDARVAQRDTRTACANRPDRQRTTPRAATHEPRAMRWGRGQRSTQVTRRVTSPGSSISLCSLRAIRATSHTAH